MSKKKPAKKPPAKKPPAKKKTRPIPPPVFHDLADIFERAGSNHLYNEWTGQIVAVGVKVDQVSARVDDIAAALSVVNAALAELQKFDQYIYDAVKRHEEQFHQPVSTPESVAADAAAAPWPPGSI